MSREKINLEFFSSGASEVAIYLIVKKDEAVKAIKALHWEYFISDRDPGIVCQTVQSPSFK